MKKTIKEIAKEGLTEAQWRDFERRTLFNERRRLLKAGRIRYKTIPTPLVPDPDGHIKCTNGKTYGFYHGRV